MQLDLKTARLRRRWSVNDLAARSGVNKSTISRLERGKTAPTLKTARALETALRMRVRYPDLDGSAAA